MADGGVYAERRVVAVKISVVRLDMEIEFEQGSRRSNSGIEHFTHIGVAKPSFAIKEQMYVSVFTFYWNSWISFKGIDR